MKTLILIVAYEAENHIQSVLSRIPWSRLQGHGKVLVLDDASTDHTSALASSWIPPNNAWPIQVLKNPVNLGYGGIRKLDIVTRSKTTSIRSYFFMEMANMRPNFSQK